MDYIRIEDAIETIHRYFNELLNLLPTQINGGYEVYLNTERVNALLAENKALCELIKALPAADVVERKKGKWIKRKNRACWFCSECNTDNYYAYTWNSDTEKNEFQDNYCPNCGAYMREE